MSYEKTFVSLITKLEPVEFLGVARVMCVDIMDEDTPRDFYDILDDMVRRLYTMGRSQRRQLMSVIKHAGKEHVPDPAH